jgi:hypothetical protein
LTSDQIPATDDVYFDLVFANNLPSKTINNVAYTSGWLISVALDTDPTSATSLIRNTLRYTAGAKIEYSKLCMLAKDGMLYPFTNENNTTTTKTQTNAVFDLSRIEIYQSNTTVNAGAVSPNGNLVLTGSFTNFRNQFNQYNSFSNYDTVWGEFKVNTDGWSASFMRVTNTLPTSEQNGYVYVLICNLQTVPNSFDLSEYHPVVEYRNGRICPYNPDSISNTTAFSVALTGTAYLPLLDAYMNYNWDGSYSLNTDTGNFTSNMGRKKVISVNMTAYHGVPAFDNDYDIPSGYTIDVYIINNTGATQNFIINEIKNANIYGRTDTIKFMNGTAIKITVSKNVNYTFFDVNENLMGR